MTFYDAVKFEGIDGPGLYCIKPSAIDNYFKIGLASDLRSRLDSYCTAYPTGFYVYWLWTEIPRRELHNYERVVLEKYGKGRRKYQNLEINCGTRYKNTEWFRFEKDVSNADRVKIMRRVLESLRASFELGDIIDYM